MGIPIVHYTVIDLALRHSAVCLFTVAESQYLKLPFFLYAVSDQVDEVLPTVDDTLLG